MLNFLSKKDERKNGIYWWDTHNEFKHKLGIWRFPLLSLGIMLFYLVSGVGLGLAVTLGAMFLLGAALHHGYVMSKLVDVFMLSERQIGVLKTFLMYFGNVPDEESDVIYKTLDEHTPNLGMHFKDILIETEELIKH